MASKELKGSQDLDLTNDYDLKDNSFDDTDEMKFGMSIDRAFQFLFCKFLSKLYKGVLGNEHVQVHQAFVNNGETIVHAEPRVFENKIMELGTTGSVDCSICGFSVIISITSFIDRGCDDKIVCKVGIHKKNESDEFSPKKAFMVASKETYATSHLKGSYIEMPGELFSWDVQEIPDENEAFLPKEVNNDINFYIQNYKKQGKLMKYLMSGPPGYGKTKAVKMLASVLQKEGVTVIKTTVTEDIAVKFNMARWLSPALLILDDIDLSLGNRENDSKDKLLESFLDVMDGVRKVGEGVGVLATTNSPSMLDIAAQRPGRFDRVLMADYLTKKNISSIVDATLEGLNMWNDEEREVAEAISDKKAKELMHDHGFSGARVEKVVEDIVDRVRSGVLKKEEVINSMKDLVEKEKKIIDSMSEKSQGAKRVEKEGEGKRRAVGYGRDEDEDEDEEELGETEQNDEKVEEGAG